MFFCETQSSSQIFTQCIEEILAMDNLQNKHVGCETQKS